MRRELNPGLDRMILDTLDRKYRLSEKRVGLHLSSLIGCLTKAGLDQTSPIAPTDTELLLFSTGYGLQEAMFPVGESELAYEKEGIVYRPDSSILVKGQQQLIEVKSTRAGVKKYQEGELPESWIIYMKGGCYIRGLTSYNLSVIYVAERPTAKIISETITFDQDELDDNWAFVLNRKELYEHAIAAHTIVPPYSTAPDWMCKNCRYNFVCEAISIMDRTRGRKDDC